MNEPMKLETLRAFLYQKPGTTEGFPFGPDVAVFKVMGKMYALFGWSDTPLRLNLKCDPDLAEVLRATYPCVQPGYHMSKRHWNTVILDGSLEEAEVFKMINHSYDLVAKSLKKADRLKLAELGPA